uniref:Rhomboid domain-containing protein 2 isoform X1 n=2 Tax=Pogona vitticeps TaxID=103695 RepID=A0A6J0UIX2_9SAUR
MERRFPAAAAFTVLLSLLVSVPRLLRWGAEGGPLGDSPSAFSLRPEAVRGLEVYRLVTYIFVYEDVISLVCGTVLIWYFASSFEKSVGTARHCCLTVSFAVASALLYLLLWGPLSGHLEVAALQGFTPLALAMLAASVARSRMRRTLLLGVNVRMALVPWLLLGFSWLIPNSSFLGNTCGLLVGNVYGYSYCLGMDLPESTVSRLDQKLPFRLLKRIPGLTFIPGSLAERRASQSRKLNPVPGSYPTQSYHSPLLPAAFTLPGQQSSPQIQAPGPPYMPGLAPQPTASVAGGTPAPNQLHHPPGSFPPSLHLTGSNWQVPRKTDGSGVHQTAGVLAAGAAPEAMGLCRVHVG